MKVTRNLIKGYSYHTKSVHYNLGESIPAYFPLYCIVKKRGGENYAHNFRNDKKDI